MTCGISFTVVDYLLAVFRGHDNRLRWPALEFGAGVATAIPSNGVLNVSYFSANSTICDILGVKWFSQWAGIRPWASQLPQGLGLDYTVYTVVCLQLFAQQDKHLAVNLLTLLSLSCLGLFVRDEF
jgi:hypothetical protein